MLSCFCVCLQHYVKLATYDVVLYPLRQVIFHLEKSSLCVFFKLPYLAVIPAPFNDELYFSLPIIRYNAVPDDSVVKQYFFKL